MATLLSKPCSYLLANALPGDTRRPRAAPGVPLAWRRRLPVLSVAMAVVWCGAMPWTATLAQSKATTPSKTPVQIVNPPKTQLWMDLSTGGMAGMPELDIPGLGGVVGGLMGLFGKPKEPAAAPGKTTGTLYGAARTPHMLPPRVVDLALWNSLKPGADATQMIPSGMRMGESLPLMPVLQESATPVATAGEPGEVPRDVKAPKGRLLMYWGCSATVRPGQPRVLDFSKLGAGGDTAATQASMQAFGTAFAGRFAPDRGAKVKTGYAVFPNERNQKTLPKGATLVGEHRITGDGIPASFQFLIGPEEDLMPPIDLQTNGSLQDSIALSWGNVTNARGYYLHAMSIQGDDIILWSSSDTADSGMGLFDYLPNATIDRWTKDKVLLSYSTTQCAIPQGILAGQGKAAAPGAGDRPEGGAAFLRMVAFGGEHNLVYPERPADPKVPWDQEWAVRIRVKSHTMAMLGQNLPGRHMPTDAAGAERKPDQEPQEKPPSLVPSAAGLLRGLFGK